MQTNMMHVLLLNTYRGLISVFQVHSQFLPSKESLDSSEVDTILEMAHPPGISPQVSLFWSFEWFQ